MNIYEKKQEVYLNITAAKTLTFILFLALVVLSIRIGFRDLSIGTDYERYVNNYLHASYLYNNQWQREIGYDLIVFIFSSFKLQPNIFFAFISILTIALNVLTFNEISKLLEISSKRKTAFLFFSTLFFLVSPFSWSSLLNIIKQGISVPFLILGFSFLMRKKYIGGFLSFALAQAFHSASIIFILVGFAFIYNKKLTFIMVIVLSFAYISKYTTFIAMIIDRFTGLSIYSAIMSYGKYAFYYQSGYRYDFLLFSLCPFILTVLCFLLYKKDKKERDRLGKINHLYAILLLPFLLSGYGAFMDRWLVPAWGFLPVFGALFFTERAENNPNYIILTGITTIFVVILIIMLRWKLSM